MKVYIVISIFVTFSDIVFSQNFDNTNWELMADVEYKKSQDEYGEIFVPIFNDNVKSLEGKNITLPGYIIPFEGMFKPEHIIISSLPVASCFFCGNGGPETVAEVYLEEPIKYTANAIKVRGKLELNDTDYDKLMYILKDAIMIGKLN